MKERLKKFVGEAAERYHQGAGIVGGVFAFFQGRSTFFAIIFTVAGIVQEVRGKLSMAFVALISAIQGFTIVHSAKEDWNQQKQSAQATVNVVNNVSGSDAKAATPSEPVAKTDPKSA